MVEGGNTPSHQAWLDFPELPGPAEVMAGTATMPPINDVRVLPADKAAYLETQYKLLRHEGIEPLRLAVQEYKGNPDMKESQETNIYAKASFRPIAWVKGVNIIRLGIMIRVSFSTARARAFIDWPNSQRLVPGTVVALTTATDKFKSQCWTAVVTGRYDQACGSQPSTVDLELPGVDVAAHFIDPALELVMIEARSNYFEAVRYVMEGLKLAVDTDSKFDKYLVGGQKEVDFSTFITQTSPVIDIAPLVPEKSRTEIPALGDVSKELLEQAGLDKSQMFALQHMAGKEFAIVQGPPGTGKTHTSMASLRVILHSLPTDMPIVVTAQKNETVDEILRRCHGLGYKFTRLGGQTTDEVIAEHTMYKLRAKYHVKRAKKTLGENPQKSELGFLRSRAEDLIRRCFPPGLLDPQDLLYVSLLTADQCTSLSQVSRDWEIKDSSGGHDENPFRFWLGDLVERAPEQGFDPSPRKPPSEKKNGVDAGSSKQALSNAKKEQLSGNPIFFQRFLTANIPEAWDTPTQTWRRTAKAILEANSNLYAIPGVYRGIVYRYLEAEYAKISRVALKAIFERLTTLAREMKMSRCEEDVTTLKRSKARIIGCTTTGLSKYRELIAAMKPGVMLVEEAAETREANLACAMFLSLEQVILVGDHLQLKPHADVMMLGKHPYNLDISMFQRLVEYGMEYSTLQVQRRMVSDIRKILNIWYPKLTDHVNAMNQDRIPGMGGRALWWFNHKQHEETNALCSKSNSFEAGMITSFARYLVKNGAKPSEITFLSFYNGQKSLLETRVRKDYLLSPKEGSRVNICTVDGYQGQENKIILISVTRSPQEGERAVAGFLASLNRAIVSLSRAKCLLVIFGDLDNLLSVPAAKAVWGEVATKLKANVGKHYGTYLPVICKEHGRVTRIYDPAGFGRIKDGGCGKKCGGKLPCGHVCGIVTCHGSSHELIQCRQNCGYMLPCGHGCGGRCGKECFCRERCETKVQDPVYNEFESLDAFLEREVREGLGLDKPDAVVTELRSHVKPAADSAQSSATLVAAHSSKGSALGTWANWDRTKLDAPFKAQIEESKKRSQAIGSRRVIYRDYYREVTADLGINRAAREMVVTETIQELKALKFEGDDLISFD